MFQNNAALPVCDNDSVHVHAKSVAAPQRLPGSGPGVLRAVLMMWILYVPTHVRARVLVRMHVLIMQV